MATWIAETWSSGGDHDGDIYRRDGRLVLFHHLLMPKGPTTSSIGLGSASPFFGPMVLGLESQQTLGKHHQWAGLVAWTSSGASFMPGSRSPFSSRRSPRSTAVMGRMTGLPDYLDDVFLLKPCGIQPKSGRIAIEIAMTYREPPEVEWTGEGRP